MNNEQLNFSNTSVLEILKLDQKKFDRTYLLIPCKNKVRFMYVYFAHDSDSYNRNFLA